MKCIINIMIPKKDTIVIVILIENWLNIATLESKISLSWIIKNKQSMATPRLSFVSYQASIVPKKQTIQVTLAAVRQTTTGGFITQ